MGLVILTAICLLMVIGSLLLTLNASVQLEQLKQQNQLMQSEFNVLREEYAKLTQSFQIKPTISVPVSPTPAAEEAPASPVSKPETPREHLIANAYKLQSLLETFAMQHQSKYPYSLEELENYANQKNINEMITNPFSDESGLLASSEMCIDITLDPADEGIVENKGKMLYQANPDSQDDITNYTIALFDEQGILLRQENGDIFSLNKA